jgi:hypothetical protein
MNDKPTAGGAGAPADAGPDDRMTALFAGMVMQQTNMALVLLGAAPHPETGQTLHDIDSARLFIDQLEMLEGKTRGNLSPREEKLLKQSLMTLRLAFVEAVDRQAGPPEEAPPAPDAAGASRPGPATPAEGTASSASPEDESRKKFSKKY